MEYLLPYLCIVVVPHIMVRLERMLDYRGVGLERFHCTCVRASTVSMHFTSTSVKEHHILCRLSLKQCVLHFSIN